MESSDIEDVELDWVVPISRHDSMTFERPTSCDKALVILKWVVQSAPFSAVMTAATIWALFADDFSHLLLPKSIDLSFLIVTTVVFVLVRMER